MSTKPGPCAFCVVDECGHVCTRACDKSPTPTRTEFEAAALPPLPDDHAGFRTRYRSEPGMIGHYPWTYADQGRRRNERPETEYENLYTADQMREYARTAIAAAMGWPTVQEKGGWLPIGTAPKDRPIFLSNGETVAQGEWLSQPAYIREHRDLEGHYIDQDEFDGFDGWIDYAGGMLPEPTHWMPLPPAPTVPEVKS